MKSPSSFEIVLPLSRLFMISLVILNESLQCPDEVLAHRLELSAVDYRKLAQDSFPTSRDLQQHAPPILLIFAFADETSHGQSIG